MSLFKKIKSIWDAGINPDNSLPPSFTPPDPKGSLEEKILEVKKDSSRQGAFHQALANEEVMVLLAGKPGLRDSQPAEGEPVPVAMFEIGGRDVAVVITSDARFKEYGSASGEVNPGRLRWKTRNLLTVLPDHIDISVNPGSRYFAVDVSTRDIKNDLGMTRFTMSR